MAPPRHGQQKEQLAPRPVVLGVVLLPLVPTASPRRRQVAVDPAAGPLPLLDLRLERPYAQLAERLPVRQEIRENYFPQ